MENKGDEKAVAVQYIGDVERLVLNPDDVVVLSIDQQLSVDQVERFKKALRGALGEDRRVIVLGKGMKIGVLGAGDAPSTPERVDTTRLRSNAPYLDAVGSGGAKASLPTYTPKTTPNSAAPAPRKQQGG